MKHTMFCKRLSFIYFGLFILLMVCITEGLMQGYTSYSPVQLYEGVLYWVQGLSNTNMDAAIIGELRLPRIIMAMAVGMGLSTSGIVMQSIFKNPMADPYILGISSGAALGIVASVTLGLGAVLGSNVIQFGAFLGALIISLIAIFASNLYQKNPSRFLMIGVALGAICSALAGVLIFIGASKSGIDLTLYWMMGSISFVPLGQSIYAFVVALLAFFFFTSQSRILNLMREGQQVAITLGYSLYWYIKGYLFINAILVGSIVMNSGLIGFVGLLIPHLVRIFVGDNTRVLLPLTAFIGMIVSLLADVVGRTMLHGVDIPLGITFAIIGAPVFIILLIRHNC
ncbi:FecCD family ABC transporter permease [Veillonella sp.]|uniref:FecCD family ABC transporter permease n=1 Tax=Veillonella sp. TaxID=1926307 RepID=UPI0035A070DA